MLHPVPERMKISEPKDWLLSHNYPRRVWNDMNVEHEKNGSKFSTERKG